MDDGEVLRVEPPDADLTGRLRAGHDDAFREFFDRYGEMLRRVAQQRLGAAIRRRLDADDLVQSVCRTFFRRAADGQLKITDTESLWRLLCVITVVKSREKIRFHLRQQRSVRNEQYLDVAAADVEAAPPSPVDPGESPDQVVEFTERLELIVASLDQEEQRVLELKLQGFANSDVAERLQCSQRTVRRLMQTLRTRLERFFEDD